MTNIVAAFARQQLADMEELQHDLGRRWIAGRRPGLTPRARPQRAAAPVHLGRRLSTSAEGR